MAKQRATGPSTFGAIGRLVTPGTTDLPDGVKAVVCLGAGDITIVPADNDNAVTITFTGVPAGYVPPYVVRRVTAATMAVATVEG